MYIYIYIHIYIYIYTYIYMSIFQKVYHFGMKNNQAKNFFCITYLKIHVINNLISKGFTKILINAHDTE